jgi:hypothetical protein
VDSTERPPVEVGPLSRAPAAGVVLSNEEGATTIEGKAARVTGANRDIGRALVEQCREERREAGGMRVGVNASRARSAVGLGRDRRGADSRSSRSRLIPRVRLRPERFAAFAFATALDTGGLTLEFWSRLRACAGAFGSPAVLCPGLEDGSVYDTYSTFQRGVDALWGMYSRLGRAPLGRHEAGIWWRRHDEYASRGA